MGGAEPPYIYEPMPGSRRSVAYPYSDFNPRAATQAHYAALAERAERQRRRQQQSGKPLINFNQHPDSYMIVSEQNTHFEPLPPNTKKVVSTTRWVHFALRCIEEVVAIGLLVCVICLKMELNSVGWISRIAPAWDILVSMYAIYHLIRPAKSRTPASSASYHFFALFMDTALIPFYIFVTLCADQNWAAVAGVAGRWTSFFSSDQTTTELIMLTFIGSAIMAGLHFVSIGFDFYLIIMFRKIARLPPDMNPLEDNLTSRRTRSTRHKHKNSEATLVSDSAEPFSEKKEQYLSGSTLSVDRLSRVSTAKGPEARTMPFSHSRMNSDSTFSPHNPETARWSRQQFEDAHVYPGSNSARNSRVDLPHGRHARTDSMSPSKRSTLVEHSQEQRPRSYVSGYPNSTDRQSKTNLSNYVAPTDTAVRSQQKEHLLNDNWYVLGDDHHDNNNNTSTTDDANYDLGNARFPQPDLHPTTSTSPYTITAAPKQPPHHERHDSFDPQPLRMNPPTPPLADEPDNTVDDIFRPLSDYEPFETGIARALTLGGPETASSSIYSTSAASAAKQHQQYQQHQHQHQQQQQGKPSPSGSPRKGKYYGDLAAATRGVRGAAAGHVRGGYGVLTAREEGMHGNGSSPEKATTTTTTTRPDGGRVVSRTGADIGDAGTAYAPGHGPWAGMRGRREVSGKAAEEGRGNGGGVGGRAMWVR